MVTLAYKLEHGLKLGPIGIFAAGLIGKGFIHDQAFKLACIILVNTGNAHIANTLAAAGGLCCTHHKLLFQIVDCPFEI